LYIDLNERNKVMNKVTNITIQRFPANSEVRPTEDGYYIGSDGEYYKFTAGWWFEFEENQKGYYSYHEWVKSEDPVWDVVHGPIPMDK